MTKKKMSILEMKKRAWASLSNNMITIGIIAEIYFLCVLGCTVFSAIGIGIIADYVISPILLLGLNICILKLIRNEEFVVGDIWNGYGNMGRAIALNLVNSIYISLWSLLFVIPGIIKTYEYALSFLVLADNPDMTQSDAREESKRLMKGNILRLFVLDLSFLLIQGLCYGLMAFLYYMGGLEIAFFLGGAVMVALYFLILPYSRAQVAVFYEAVKEEKAPPVYIPIEELENQHRASNI